MTDEEHVRRAEQAKAILDHALWREAWDVYRARLLAQMEAASDEDVDGVMHAKRLLLVAQEARSYLEQLVQQGAISAETIKITDDRKRWFR